MYAGPVLGLGIGLGLAIVCERSGLAQTPRSALQLAAGAAIVSMLVWHALEPQPEPTLAPGACQGSEGAEKRAIRPRAGMGLVG